jgi:hypothetical protein
MFVLNKMRCSSGSEMADYELDNWGLITGGSQCLFFPPPRPGRRLSSLPSTFYLMGTCGSYPGAEAARA